MAEIIAYEQYECKLDVIKLELLSVDIVQYRKT